MTTAGALVLEEPVRGAMVLLPVPPAGPHELSGSPG
jgi:hypothetical protein